MRKMTIFSVSMLTVAWGLMTFIDLLSEMNVWANGIFMMVCIYGLWIPAVVAYIMFMKQTGEVNKHIKLKAMDKAVWVGISVLFAVPISILVEKNIWLVDQGPSFLNGIEYPVFGIFFTVLSLFGFWIYDIVVFIIDRRRERNER